MAGTPFTRSTLTAVLSPLSAIAPAERALARSDPVMASLIKAAGPCQLGVRPRRTHFETLARSITFQQLAGPAATTIYGRFRALVPKLTPEAVLALPEDSMRGTGLSAAKTAAIRDLAAAALDGRLRLPGLSRVSDDEIIERLVTVRGIGRWTAEMFLMFQLGRLDVWPVGDLGVRNGYARAYALAAPPKPLELDALGERFRPWRSVAAWYCWRAVDTVTPA